MKKPAVVTSLFLIFGAPALLLAGQITSDCKRQAKEYSIQPELVSQYVSDCVASMGGEVATEPAQATSSDEGKREGSENNLENPLVPQGSTAIQ